jgi:para-nitrobenzyl esterase
VTIAQFHAAAGNPVWQYEFSHAFPESKRGAPHSGELRYVFGSFPDGAVSYSEKKISNDIETYWTNFAKTGDPNGNGLPTWLKYDTQARGYLEFTDNGPVQRNNLRGDFCSIWTDYLKRKMSK